MINKTRGSSEWSYFYMWSHRLLLSTSVLTLKTEIQKWVNGERRKVVLYSSLLFVPCFSSSVFSIFLVAWEAWHHDGHSDIYVEHKWTKWILCNRYIKFYFLEPFHIVQLILSENANFSKFIILHNGKYNLIQSIKKPGNLDDSSWGYNFSFII